MTTLCAIYTYYHHFEVVELEPQEIKQPTEGHPARKPGEQGSDPTVCVFYQEVDAQAFPNI